MKVCAASASTMPHIGVVLYLTSSKRWHVFINELLISIQAMVAQFKESKSRPDLFYDELVNYSQDERELHQASIGFFYEATKAKPKKNE